MLWLLLCYVFMCYKVFVLLFVVVVIWVFFLVLMDGVFVMLCNVLNLLW